MDGELRLEERLGWRGCVRKWGWRNGWRGRPPSACQATECKADRIKMEAKDEHEESEELMTGEGGLEDDPYFEYRTGRN
eukprot:15459233-Alexandrium_andersonii.AAC.1